MSARDSGSRLQLIVMYYFYVLRSLKTGMFYKGHTGKLKVRISQHNEGKTRSTSSGIPWELIYSEEFTSQEEAIAREKYFKTLQGGKDLKKLLND